MSATEAMACDEGAAVNKLRLKYNKIPGELYELGLSPLGRELLSHIFSYHIKETIFDLTNAYLASLFNVSQHNSGRT